MHQDSDEKTDIPAAHDGKQPPPPPPSDNGETQERKAPSLKRKPPPPPSDEGEFIDRGP